MDFSLIAPEPDAADDGVNVGGVERALSAAAGIAPLAWGATRSRRHAGGRRAASRS